MTRKFVGLAVALGTAATLLAPITAAHAGADQIVWDTVGNCPAGTRPYLFVDADGHTVLVCAI